MNSNTLRRRILSLRFCARLYTNNSNVESPASRTPQNSRRPPRASTQQQAHHEAHEGTTALNAPLNPPGGGSGGSTGGGAFTFTKSPILDAMLTTAIGLGAGKRICTTHLTIPAKYSIP